ncbi:MAG: biotin transporter BioY [Proteobacteria bacterium]|nr:biotin transporter BioY [Pseudomonadota bacterium]
MIRKNRTHNFVLTALTVAFMTAGAWIRVPAGPVPFSLQTLFVLLSGITLGPRLGAAAMGVYLTLGLIGLPVFAAGGGPGYLLSPTFGFLLAFPLASFVTGWAAGPEIYGKKITGTRLALALFAGTAVVYLVGLPWLYLNLKFVQGRALGAGSLLLLGFVPFLPGDLVKILMAFFLSNPLRQAVRSRRS